jgi:hypothetical protein
VQDKSVHVAAKKIVLLEVIRAALMRRPDQLWQISDARKGCKRAMPFFLQGFQEPCWKHLTGRRGLVTGKLWWTIEGVLCIIIIFFFLFFFLKTRAA